MTSLMQTKPVHAVERPAVRICSGSANVAPSGEVRESRKSMMRLVAVKVCFMVVTSGVQMKPKLSNFWAKV